MPVEPRRAPMGAFRRPVPSDFSQSGPAPRASAPPRASASGGTSIGYAPARRPGGNPASPSRHGSQFHPAQGSGNRPPSTRPSGGAYRPDDRRDQHTSMPGERIARSGGRPG
jgi:hypothetical protein